jgi:hypothetical protein
LGEVQLVQPSPSSLHSKLLAESEEMNVNVASVL